MYPRRLKAEAFSNEVDVVERLRDPTDPSTNVRHLRVQHMFSMMTSLELLPVEGEFRQHDDVATVMMMLPA